MASTFNKKLEAILDKVAQSAKAHSWKRPLFWVAAAAFVLFSIFKEVLEGLFEATENISLPNDSPIKHPKSQGELDEIAQQEGWLFHQSLVTSDAFYASDDNDS